ncbi:hypothetical protein HYW76_02915 [Candidatus Pacearchaeota archaeon]|nr:hypothetical protein [Candidatus Pacearchaeota archaeon]
MPQDKNHTPRAEHIFDQAVKKECLPTSPGLFHYCRGIARFQSRRFQEACLSLQESLASSYSDYFLGLEQKLRELHQRNPESHARIASAIDSNKKELENEWISATQMQRVGNYYKAYEKLAEISCKILDFLLKP